MTTVHRKQILVLLLIALAACTPAADEITIGGLYALTGYGSQFGTDEHMGTQLAVEDINAAGGINGKHVRLVAEDFATDTTTVATAYRKLVDFNDVEYIVGPTWGTFVPVIISNLQDDGVILISPSTGESLDLYKNPNFFKTWPSDWDEFPALFNHMQAQNVQRMTVVVSQGSWSENMIEGYRYYAQEYDIEIIKEFRFNPDQVDFRTMITQLKEFDADATFITFSNYESVGEFLSQRNELGYDKPLYGWSGFERHALLENYGAALEEVYYSVPVITEKD